MDFSAIGSIGAYTRAMKMQMQWKQKADSGDYTRKADSGVSAQSTQADLLKKQLEEVRDSGNADLGAIYTKLSTGKKLTTEEMAYLKEKDPAAYQKAKEIQAERARFKEELKRCRTKEDFQRLKTMHMSASMARVNAVANDSDIPKTAKMALLVHENAKLKAIAEAEQEFVKSGAYHRLPTDAERSQEIKEKERRQAESERPEPETAEGEEWEITGTEKPWEPEGEDAGAVRGTRESSGPEKSEGVHSEPGKEREEPLGGVNPGHRQEGDRREPAFALKEGRAGTVYGKNLYRENMSLENQAPPPWKMKNKRA
ncbi:MAG: hypothetical protein LIP16_04610 [Clostridium sp.]|nr:hypothetical protein [Clostridium sp.]